jgi:hypothetical protein
MTSNNKILVCKLHEHQIHDIYIFLVDWFCVLLGCEYH